MLRTVVVAVVVISLASCAVNVDDGVALHEWATQTHDFLGNVGAVVNQCFASSPADGDDPPGEGAAMESSEFWTGWCEQERIAGGWPAIPACSMSYWSTGRDCE